MPPEPVEASSMSPALPVQISTLPEPVWSRHGAAGVPSTLILPEPVPACSPPCRFFSSIDPEPVLGLHVAGADLLGVDVARAGANGESALEAGGMNRSRAGAQFCICAHAFVGHVAGAGSGIEKGVGRSLNFIIDADVAEGCGGPSDAHDVACLLDGRMSSDLLHHVVARAPA